MYLDGNFILYFVFSIFIKDTNDLNKNFRVMLCHYFLPLALRTFRTVAMLQQLKV
jgi:hypothetical protein